MFNGEPCEKNYATQLLNVGSLHNFITDYDVAKKRLFYQTARGSSLNEIFQKSR